MYKRFTLLYTWNYYNIVSQLYSNKIKKKGGWDSKGQSRPVTKVIFIDTDLWFIRTPIAIEMKTTTSYSKDLWIETHLQISAEWIQE